MKDGIEVPIPVNRLFASAWKIKTDGIGELEAYSNRNAISYIALY